MKIGTRTLLAIIATTVLSLSSTPLTFGQGTWQTYAPMPMGRTGASAGVINGKLYVAAGIIPTTDRINVPTIIYDPLTDAWTSGAQIPVGLYAGASGVINGKLYVASGQPYGYDIANLQVYDPATDSWTNKAPMPYATSTATAGVINGKLYVAGGDGASNSLIVYDPTTDGWTFLASMPTGRSWTSSGVINGILYVVGGNNGTDLATVEAYDPTTDTWTTKASMPTAKSMAIAEVINGILYVVGGTNMNGSNALATVEAYDASTDTWTTETPMPTAREQVFGGVLNGSLYVIGGSTTGSDQIATNEAFTPTPPYSTQVQQPINSDGSSVFNVRRGVVPVKFTLTQGGVATCALAPATIALTRTAGGTIGAIDESIYVGAADTGSNFRIDSCQYIYNLSASALGVGIYRVDITINGQVVGSATFQLK